MNNPLFCKCRWWPPWAAHGTLNTLCAHTVKRRSAPGTSSSVTDSRTVRRITTTCSPHGATTATGPYWTWVTAVYMCGLVCRRLQSANNKCCHRVCSESSDGAGKDVASWALLLRSVWILLWPRGYFDFLYWNKLTYLFSTFIVAQTTTFCIHCFKSVSVCFYEGFHEKDGKAYCRKDYFDMFAPKCGGCARAILENYISALNSLWHPECFVCRVCILYSASIK